MNSPNEDNEELKLSLREYLESNKDLLIAIGILFIILFI